MNLRIRLEIFSNTTQICQLFLDSTNGVRVLFKSPYTTLLEFCGKRIKMEKHPTFNLISWYIRELKSRCIKNYLVPGGFNMDAQRPCNRVNVLESALLYEYPLDHLRYTLLSSRLTERWNIEIELWKIICYESQELENGFRPQAGVFLETNWGESAVLGQKKIVRCVRSLHCFINYWTF